MLEFIIPGRDGDFTGAVSALEVTLLVSGIGMICSWECCWCCCDWRWVSYISSCGVGPVLGPLLGFSGVKLWQTSWLLFWPFGCCGGWSQNFIVLRTKLSSWSSNGVLQIVKTVVSVSNRFRRYISWKEIKSGVWILPVEIKMHELHIFWYLHFYCCVRTSLVQRNNNNQVIFSFFWGFLVDQSKIIRSCWWSLPGQG